MRRNHSLAVVLAELAADGIKPTVILSRHVKVRWTTPAHGAA